MPTPELLGRPISRDMAEALAVEEAVAEAEAMAEMEAFLMN
jgi:hypothetical protein